jgi:hypothetical protein
MSILFSTQTGEYLRDLQKDKSHILSHKSRRSLDLGHLMRELERLNSGDESVLAKSTQANLDKDISILNIAGFIITLIKKNSDFLVTDIRMAAPIHERLLKEK